MLAKRSSQLRDGKQWCGQHQHHGTRPVGFTWLINLPIALMMIGCIPGELGDNSSSPAQDCSPFQLRMVGSSTRALSTDASASLAVSLSDRCAQPLVGATVTFRLEGDGGGTTLSGSLVQTDTDGTATAGLTTGPTDASFQVIASTPEVLGAVHFAIQVSNACANHCANQTLDCGETGVDCGGECDPCPDPCANHCANQIRDCGETGIDCGGECDPCHTVSYPLMTFDPAQPQAGDVVLVRIADVPPHQNIVLVGTGPCGGVSLSFVDPVTQDPQTGANIWTHQTSPLTGGTFDFDFSADSGATAIVSGSLDVSGATGCVDPCQDHCTNGVRDCGEQGFDCGGECAPCPDPGIGDPAVFRCADDAPVCSPTPAQDCTTDNMSFVASEYGSTVTRADDQAHTRVVFRLIAIVERVGPSNIDVFVVGPDTAPLANVPVAFYYSSAPEAARPDEWYSVKVTALTDGTGRAGFALGGGAYLPCCGCGGPHAIWVSQPDGGSGTIPSDLADHLGMLGGTNHRHLDLLFQRVDPSPAPAPTPAVRCPL